MFHLWERRMFFEKICSSKEENKIRKNLVEYGWRRSVANFLVAANISSYIEGAQSDAEVLEVMLAAVAVDSQSSRRFTFEKCREYSARKAILSIEGARAESDWEEHLSNTLILYPLTKKDNINVVNYTVNQIREILWQKEDRPKWHKGNFKKNKSQIVGKTYIMK